MKIRNRGKKTVAMVTLGLAAMGIGGGVAGAICGEYKPENPGPKTQTVMQSVCERYRLPNCYS